MLTAQTVRYLRDRADAQSTARGSQPPDPRFDPNLNPWPLPPGWTENLHSRFRAIRPYYGWYAPGHPPTWEDAMKSFQKPVVPMWGASGWNYGQGGVMGPEGQHGIQNWLPGEMGWPHDLNPYTQRHEIGRRA